jgi:hypothetical protein
MTHEQIIENDMLLAQNSVDMKKYKKIKPDYFIEVYSGYGSCYSTSYNCITKLKEYLKSTKDKGLKTIAIFKIKKK